MWRIGRSVLEYALSLRLSDSSMKSNLLDNPCLYGGRHCGKAGIVQTLLSYNAPSSHWVGDMIISLLILQQMTALSHPCWSKLPKTPQTRISWSLPGNNWFNLCLWQLYLEAQVYLWQQLFVIGCPPLSPVIASCIHIPAERFELVLLLKDGAAVGPRWIFTLES